MRTGSLHTQLLPTRLCTCLARIPRIHEIPYRICLRDKLCSSLRQGSQSQRYRCNWHLPLMSWNTTDTPGTRLIQRPKTCLLRIQHKKLLPTRLCTSLARILRIHEIPYRSYRLHHTPLVRLVCSTFRPSHLSRKIRQDMLSRSRPA